MDQPAADTTVIKGILASITGFGVFAIGDALGKWLTHDYPITELIFFNGLFGLLSVMAASPFFGGLRSIFRTKQLGLHILRALIIVSQCFMVVYAFSNLPMANVYAFVFAAPLIITALSAPVLGQRVGMREWIGVLSGFTGIMIMLRPGVQPLDLPTLAAIGTAVFFSIGSIMVRMMGNRGGFRDGENMFSYSAYPMLIMAPVGAVCCLIWGFKMPETGVDLMLFMGPAQCRASAW